MEITKLSIDELEKIVYVIDTPKDLLRLMMTCKMMKTVVKRHPVWSTLLTRYNLQTPPKKPKKRMLDFDVIMKNVCSCCFEQLACQYGLCKACRHEIEDLNFHNWKIRECQRTLRSIGQKRFLVPEWQKLEEQRQSIQKEILEHKRSIERIVRRACDVWES